VIAHVVRRIAAPAGLLSCVPAAVQGGYLLALLAASVRARRSPSAADQASSAGVVVVIPAHDEATQVQAAIASVSACDYPLSRRRIVVVADNCSDATADIARAAGAEVWERRDPARRGKGYALGWAFAMLVGDVAAEAIAVVDADCEVSANFLTALVARVHAGADAVQVRYVISDPERSASAALRWAGFALVNVVRPMGRTELGASSGLLGTGMAFSRRLLLRSPWRAVSFAEDREQHMRWVLAGCRVAFANEAEVRAPAAASRAGQVAQERRWESGRLALLKEFTSPLLWRFLQTGEVSALDAGLEPLLMPQSTLMGLNLLSCLTARVAGTPTLRHLSSFAVLAQLTYVLGGLRVAGAPPEVWRAMLQTPRFVARRLRLLAASALAGAPAEWERTARPEGA
jgi:1,2-diacylglycerol 3-beta-glucosyltransferase